MRVGVPSSCILRHRRDRLLLIFGNAQNENAFHILLHTHHRFLRTGCKTCLQKQWCARLSVP
jgi:hypothetical protein